MPSSRRVAEILRLRPFPPSATLLAPVASILFPHVLPERSSRSARMRVYMCIRADLNFGIEHIVQRRAFPSSSNSDANARGIFGKHAIFPNSVRELYLQKLSFIYRTNIGPFVAFHTVMVYRGNFARNLWLSSRFVVISKIPFQFIYRIKTLFFCCNSTWFWLVSEVISITRN